MSVLTCPNCSARVSSDYVEDCDQCPDCGVYVCFDDDESEDDSEDAD